MTVCRQPQETNAPYSLSPPAKRSYAREIPLKRKMGHRSQMRSYFFFRRNFCPYLISLRGETPLSSNFAPAILVLKVPFATSGQFSWLPPWRVCVEWCLLVAGGGLHAGEIWLKLGFFLPDSNGHPHCAEHPWTDVPCKSRSSSQLTAPPCPYSPRTELSGSREGKKAV